MNSSNVIIGLLNPKSVGNVGSVLRAAGCFGGEAIFYTGKRYTKAAKFQTDTKNISKLIPLTGVEDLLEHIPANSKIVCVELVEGAASLPEFQHPQEAFYIFGPEDGTIDQAIIDKADSVVFIPAKACLNLAATVNVVLYDRSVKLNLNIDNDELIREIRDRNNKVTFTN